MSNAVAVTDADFEQEIEKHDGLAVVDFWATWCGPCRLIAPILDQLAVPAAERAFASFDKELVSGTAMPVPQGVFPRFVEPAQEAKKGAAS